MLSPSWPTWKYMRVCKIRQIAIALKKIRATELFYPITFAPKNKIGSLMLSTNSDTVTQAGC